MSPPVSRSQPRREFGSPTANIFRSNLIHTKAKFHIDLTQDSDSVAPESDSSDEPVFVRSQLLDRQQQHARVDFDSKRGFKSAGSGFFGRLHAGLDALARPLGNEFRDNDHATQQQQQPPPPPPPRQQAQSNFQTASTPPFGRSSTRPSPSNSATRGNVHPYHGSASRDFPARPVPNPMIPPALGIDPAHQSRQSSRSLLHSRSPPSAASPSSLVPPKLQKGPVNGLAAHERPSTRDSHGAAQITPPSSSRFDTSGQESPNPRAMGETQKRTPQKVDWSVDKLAEALHERSADMRKSHQDLVNLTINSVKPVERRVMTGVDFFATVSHAPVAPEDEKTDDMLKIRIKHHTRGKKDQSTVHYQPLLFKTLKPRVPKYRFHHKEISRNVLTPNTMLKFVPVIRDLEPGEDAQYNTWLKELERMDASCGFQPMGSREQRVIRTTRHERTAMLALYLDYWIDRLGIPGCNRTTLIRHMVQSEPDIEMTPHQKRMCNSLQSEGNSPRSPVAARMARMFTDAFDRVFASDTVAEERQVTLRDVLQLDRTVEEIFESKKTVKNTSQSQSQSQDAAPETTFEKLLDTYAVMGCLICFSNSCEHGDYGEKNEKRNFSLDCNGKIDELFLKAPGAAEKKDHDGTRIEPCRRDCYMVCHDMPDAVSVPGCLPWRADDEMLLQAMFAAVECSSRVRSKAQCMVAELLNRRCWEVQQHLLKLKVVVPEDASANLPKAKNLPWYDRQKKVLMGDWQSETYTHDHKSRLMLDPCRHEGPCSLANNCECVANQVLCDKFCRCTADCCSYKFTGCACGSTGKTCLQRQKEGRPCICVQLNRECDPSLCHGCGVKERADPSNRTNESLMNTGCQNCALQQGRSKAVVPGQSQLEGCGYGLFAIEPVAQHEFVIEYTGELIMHDEGVRREARRGEAFDDDGVTSYVFSLLDSEGIWVDAAIYGNHSRYINHEAYDYNVEPKVLYVNGEYRIRFSATRNIEAGEELFFNYGGNFPNLTKKMIKDKTQASDASEPGEPEPTPMKKRGRPPGKGGRPAKKEQAMRKEAPAPQAETLDDLESLDVAPRGRKRRHLEIAEQDESDDYHPSMEESESREARALARGARRHTRRRLENIEPEDIEETYRGSSRRRGRGPTRRSEVQPEPEPEPATPTPLRKRRGRPPKRQNGVRSESPGHGADDEGAAEETPGRGRRKRRLSFKGARKEIVADEAGDAEDPNQPRTPTRPITTRYGRRRSTRVADSDDEEDTPKRHEAADSADDSFSHSGMDLSRSNSRTRRERRKPARYRDSEEPV